MLTRASRAKNTAKGKRNTDNNGKQIQKKERKQSDYNIKTI